MAKSKGAKSKGSGFAGEVEGCDLGAIRSRSRTAKSKGAIRSRRALGSGFDLSLGAISLAGAWLVGGVCSLPLSPSVSIFQNPFKGKIATEIDFQLERGIFGQS